MKYAIGFITGIIFALVSVLFVPCLKRISEVGASSGTILIHTKLFGKFDIHVEDRAPAIHLLITRLCPIHGCEKSIVTWTEWISLASFFKETSGYFETHNEIGDYYATAFAVIYKIDRPNEWKIDKVKSIRENNQQNDIKEICNDVLRELRLDEKKILLKNDDPASK